MNRRILVIGILLALGIIAGGLWLYNAVLGETEAASGPIQTTPLAIATAIPPTEEPTRTEPTAIPEATDPPAADPTELPADPEPSAPAGPVVYRIDQESSEVRFKIFEELRGEPVTVVGVSDQVSGEIAVDLSDLSATQVGVIQVNARTFVTDADRRNQAIRNFILNTDQYEFIVFSPTGVSGLEGGAAPGDTFNFQIAGDLTIRDTTQPVVFDVTASAASAGLITGSAVTVVPRSAYGLTIPNVPFVANVGEEVTLEIDFSAPAVP